MPKKLYDRQKGKMRVIGLVSGSGKGIVTVIERQRELEKTSACDFEVVGILTDNPESKAMAIGQKYEIPVIVNDIRKFYRKCNKPIKDLTVREAYDRESVRLIEPFNPDVLIFAGYVWVATPVLVNQFQIINAHPADLSVMNGDTRAYGGADGIGDALKAGERQLHSSVHLVTNKVDDGPVLFISKPVAVETDADLTPQERWRKYLKLVNAESRILIPLAVEQMANGNITQDKAGMLYFKGDPIPNGHRLN